MSVAQADKAGLMAKLASPETFKNAGLDYPYTLPKLKFQIETRSDGAPYIKVTSDQSVNEPFVNLLLELSWSSGRLTREYTFLLDPPEYVQEQIPAPSVNPIESSVASAPVEPPREIQTQPQEVPPKNVPAPAPEKEAVSTAPAEKQASASVSETAIAVKRGDTLSGIAAHTKTAEVSLERMLVALYRANHDAFDGHNMNRLRAGKILQLPQEEQLAGLGQAEAVKEIHAHVADWNAYRQKLASAATRSGNQSAAGQESGGKIGAAVAEQAPKETPVAKEVLKLSKSEALTEPSGDQGKKSGKAERDRLNAQAEEAIANAKAIKEAEERAAALEQNIRDMQRLVELRAQAAQAGSAPAPVSGVEAVSAVAASAVVAPQSAVAPIQAPEPVAEPSLMDSLLSPLSLAGLATALLGALGGLIYMRRRRKAEEEGAPADVTGSRIAEPVQPSPETGDFTQVASGAAPAAFAATNRDDVDPIAEADLFLGFGRDAQAEEVLKEALRKDPDNNPVKLKLLAIYAQRHDAQSFSGYAAQIKQSGDLPAWESAAAMGRELEPDNALYALKNSADDLEPGDFGAASPALDLDLGMDEMPEVKPVEVTADFPLDFSGLSDTLSAQSNETVSPAREESDSPMDFDISSLSASAVVEEPLPVIEENPDIPMDFDVTGTSFAPLEAEAEPPALPVVDIPGAIDFPETETVSETGLDQQLTELMSAVETPAPADNAVVVKPLVAAEPDLNLDDLVFDIAASETATAPEKTLGGATLDVEDVPESDTMAFTLDIPAETGTGKSAFPAKEIELTDISLDLEGGAAAPAASEIKDEAWHEVATKMDLAKAYQEMGDAEGAREILQEVLNEGDEQQRNAAQAILQQLA